MYKSENVVRQLSSDDFSQVDNALCIIKKHYVRNVDKMQELEKYSVLHKLVSFLGHPKFCNIALSIVADACLLKFCALKVIRYDGYKCLIRIMDSLVNDEVRHRACRAIGNLAKLELNINLSEKKELISKIILFLMETVEIPNKLTAIRTLRKLSKYSGCHDIMIQENANTHFITLLSSSDQALQLCCAETLAELTENCSVECASKLIESFENLVDLFRKCDDNVKTYVVQVFRNLTMQEKVRSDLVKVGVMKLFTDIVVARKFSEITKHAILGLCNCLDYMHMWDNYGASASASLKILVETLYYDNFKEVHPNIITALETISLKDGAVSLLIDIDVPIVLIEYLRSYNEKNKFYHKNSLFEEYSPPSSPRRKFQKTSHFKSPSVNNAEDMKTYNDRLHSTNIFYNIGSNCVKNFSRTDYLDVHSSGASTYHSPSSSSSCNNVSPPYDYSSWPRACTYSETSPSCWSPLSHSTNGSCNERRDFNFSEHTTTNDEKVNSGPGEVKPAYSNMLSNSFSGGSGNKIEHFFTVYDSNSIAYKAEICHHDNTLFKKNSFNCHNNKTKDMLDSSLPFVNEYSRLTIINRVLSLLLRLSFGFQSKSYSYLAKKSYFSVLIKYITSVQVADSTAIDILLSLIKNPHCFEKLIRDEFVIELENNFKAIHAPKYCDHCSILRIVYEKLISALRYEANTYYGVGTVCHILCTTTDVCQLNVIGAISHLFFSRSSLNKSLIQGNGLSILLQWLNNISRNSEWEHAVIYLCKIYQKLKKIHGRKSDNCCISQTCKFKWAPKCTYKDDILNVSFIVDDGSKIDASREKICKNSSYFQALLAGHFKETNESIVKIHDISAELLTTIFHFLHDCYINSECCPYITGIPFKVLVELLTECDKFLLFDIITFVEDRICHNLCHTVVDKVYEKAKIYNSTTLYNRALEYALCLDVSQKDNLLECFRKLLRLHDRLDVVADIKELFQKML